MNAPLTQKYAARFGELESLGRELSGQHPAGDSGPIVGRVLEVAGDLLRRRAAVPHPSAAVEQVLRLVTEAGLNSYCTGVDEKAWCERLTRAAGQAVESAIPDADDDAQVLAGWAMEALVARDRLESSLVAVEALAGSGRGDAKVWGERLRALVGRVDGAMRRKSASFTPLNSERRREAQLLDAERRGTAWWFVERGGPEHDGLVVTLGGVPKGTLGAAERSVARLVDAPRTRSQGYDELFRYDLGISSPAEVASIRREAERDPGMKEILVALEEGERAIEELTRGEGPSSPRSAPVGSPVEPGEPPPDVVVERAEFKLLVFRSKQHLQVVVQPRQRHLRIAASLEVPGVLDRPANGHDGPHGLHIELGEPQRFLRQPAIARVTLENGMVVVAELVL